jgi:Ni,Fe-hydrogenase III large subunit/Ni,Fe-hydrogenase III component G
LFIQVEPENCRDALKILLENDGSAGISAITGIDTSETIGVMYHVRTYGIIVTIKTEVPKDNPKIASITDLIPGAEFHEREAADLLGLSFEGSHNPKRLVLPEDWPSGLYPLRKDAFTANVPVKIESSNSSTENEHGPNEETFTTVIMGPQHPAFIEPEKFSLTVEGEVVKKVEPRIGYVHRGVEKAAESRTYLQDVYLVERICGICNSCHATCFCQAVEAIMGIDIPLRAKYLRTVILEINRIQSHMLLLGHAGLEIGYQTLFHYMWRDREPIMDIMEQLTGNRVIASFMAIGGVRQDLKEEATPRIKVALKKLQERMDFYRSLFEDDPTLKIRTKNVGVLSQQEALKLCVVGPVARGSGLNMDVRKDDPYAAYSKVPFNIIKRYEGDSLARLIVRLNEITESINIINQALDSLPSGPYRIRVSRTVPAGEALSHVEAPRGELFYYVKSNGTAYPERVKVRTPTFANIPAFVKIAEGGNIADVPASFVSLDPCFSCTDR